MEKVLEQILGKAGVKLGKDRRNYELGGVDHWLYTFNKAEQVEVEGDYAAVSVSSFRDCSEWDDSRQYNLLYGMHVPTGAVAELYMTDDVFYSYWSQRDLTIESIAVDEDGAAVEFCDQTTGNKQVKFAVSYEPHIVAAGVEERGG